uniref:Endo/exonuclease/phosphatase domain-containing protein n=1 Tax=Macrostomum lignano TaxID=282301 RepID=A0A1I8F6F9_9PLAT
MNNLARILNRYDILVVMEIRDKSGEAFRKLVERANRDERRDPFSYVISVRTGRHAKKQYAVLYRESVAEVLSERTVADSGDRFQREPYEVRLALRPAGRCSSSTTVLTVVCLHTEPDASVEELNALHDMLRPRRRENLLIAGDLNADCRYVNRGEMAALPLRLDPDFLWLIGDGVDTTVKSTDCAPTTADRHALGLPAHAWCQGVPLRYGFSHSTLSMFHVPPGDAIDWQPSSLVLITSDFTESCTSSLPPLLASSMLTETLSLERPASCADPGHAL